MENRQGPTLNGKAPLSFRITLMWSGLDDQRHKGDAHHDYRGRIKSKRCKNRHLHWVCMSDMQTLLASSCSPDCMCTPCLHLHPEPSRLPAKTNHLIQSSHQKFPKNLKNRVCIITLRITSSASSMLTPTISTFSLLTALSSKACMLVTDIKSRQELICTRNEGGRYLITYHYHYNTKSIDALSSGNCQLPKSRAWIITLRITGFAFFISTQKMTLSLSLSWPP